MCQKKCHGVFDFSGSRGGVFYFLCNLGKLAKRGGGGYPQALPKVINLGIMLELSEILVLVRIPPSCMSRLQQ